MNVGRMVEGGCYYIYGHFGRLYLSTEQYTTVYWCAHMVIVVTLVYILVAVVTLIALLV